MKDRSIHRDVLPKTKRRSGDLDLARLPKMSHARSRVWEKRQVGAHPATAEDLSHPHSFKRLPLVTLLFLAILLVLGVGGGVFLQTKTRLYTPQPVESALFPAKEPNHLPVHETAEELVEKALAVRDPSVMGDFFRLGQVSPQSALDFLMAMEREAGPVISCRWMGSDQEGKSIVNLQVDYEKDEPRYKRLAFLVQDAGDGRWKVDFESFARTVDASWDEFLAGDVEVLKTRVLVGKYAYFSGAFSDEKEWECYSIETRDVDAVMIGYCRTGSPQAQALQELCSSDQTVRRVYLELAKVPGAEKRQFRITRVLASDWLMGDEPFDVRFR